MKILSLFDGMSCGHVAFQRAGIPITQYFSSEIDKHCMFISRKNHPDIIQLGDVRNVRVMAQQGLLGHMDYLIAGSPCQGFSFAGKQLAFNDPRSALFFEFILTWQALRKINPNIKFLLENVKMKKEHLDVITSLLGVEPVFINSALVSAQNRRRYYWANWNFGQPEDRNVFLKDIVEGPGDLTFLNKYSEKLQKRLVSHNIKDENEKANCLLASSSRMVGGQGNTCIKINPASIVGRRINERGVRDDYNKKVPITQCLQVKHNNEKTGCLTTVYKDNVLSSLPPGRYKDAYNLPPEFFRKLTPVECERLQTLPDNYTEGVSNTQRYKMLGNGWNVETVVHVLKGSVT